MVCIWRYLCPGSSIEKRRPARTKAIATDPAMATPHLPRIAPLTASTLLGPTPDPSELVTQSWPVAGNLRSFKKELALGG